MTKYIFVTGGVISGVGKGAISASIGKILKEYGLNVTLIKLDPYINFDAGTLRPTEHGEVWVTSDGGETDQDLGTYERFMDINIPKSNSITTGQIYNSIIEQERKGVYLGATVQFIPHVPEEINKRIQKASIGFDIAIIEIGGTVGDHENSPFLFASKLLEQNLGKENVIHALVSYFPIPSHIKEMKTKPTQQAIKLLKEEGIFPDFILCRAEIPVDSIRKRKIQLFSHVPEENVISAPNVQTIYEIPIYLEKENFGYKLLKKLNLTAKKDPDWSIWSNLIKHIIAPTTIINIAIVGKYASIGHHESNDSYISINEALKHAGAQLKTGIKITTIDTTKFEQSNNELYKLASFDGIIIPGGFGSNGVEEKIKVIKYLRENNIPFLGICYGMQLAVVEFARNVCHLKTANTTEVDPKTTYPVIDILPMQKDILETNKYGGTMRLGDFKATLNKNSLVFNLYKNSSNFYSESEGTIVERHRHRYEVNPKYIRDLQNKGLIFSGFHTRSDETKLSEFIELKDHPFFVATQAHPEFKSRFGSANPLFLGFIQSALTKYQFDFQNNKKYNSKLMENIL